MKAKILIYSIFLTSLISCSGNSSIPPFSYNDNTRIVIEGKLFDENQNVISNQLVQLYGNQNGGPVLLCEVNSDNNGDFFITSPQGNYLILMAFNGKNIISTAPGGILLANSSLLGFEPNKGSYFNFNQIVLSN
jgi:hypothetical protein